MSPIVIIDTETTSLRPDREIWEVAMIRIDEKGINAYRNYVKASLWAADPISLKIGGFHERHPDYSGKGIAYEPGLIATDVEKWTRHATVFGAVPNFDTEGLADLLRTNGKVPMWHYHLQDIETLVAGYLIAKGEKLSLPWKSDDLSLAIGVDPAKFKRHEALEDCRWVLAQLEVVAPHLLAAASATKKETEAAG